MGVLEGFQETGNWQIEKVGIVTIESNSYVKYVHNHSINGFVYKITCTKIVVFDLDSFNLINFPVKIWINKL